MTHRSASHLSAALVLFVLVASSGQPARAQVESREGIALQNQILDLRRQIQRRPISGRLQGVVCRASHIAICRGRAMALAPRRLTRSSTVTPKRSATSI